MSVPARNPLHPDALSKEDLTVGLTVITFNIYTGAYDEGVILSSPYLSTTPSTPPFWPKNQIMVNIRSLKDGAFRQYDLAELGVIAFPPDRYNRQAHWSDVNFVVREDKHSTLPAPLGLPANFFAELERSLESKTKLTQE